MGWFLFLSAFLSFARVSAISIRITKANNFGNISFNEIQLGTFVRPLLLDFACSLLSHFSRTVQFLMIVSHS
jgi:hypothetical protein